MPCSHAGGGSSFDRDEDSRELERRNFMKSALMIGGANATHTSIERYGLSGTDGSAKPAAARDNRQHAWNAYLNLDARGLPDPPEYRVFLYLDYEGDGEPTAEDRAQMAAALDQLERAFEWSADGLLFSVSYGQAYWDRFDDDLPAGARLLDDAEAADAMSRGEETPAVEDADVLVDLASDHVANVLAAESALWGGIDEIAGVAIDATFEGLFDKPVDYPTRRTGFVARPEDDEEAGESGGAEPESDDAFLTMGFATGREDSQPREDHVTLVHDQVTDDGETRPPGQFAQGAVQHASRLEMDLASWYGDDLGARRERMLGPFEGPDRDGGTTATDGGAGTGLGSGGTTGLESGGTTGLGPGADAPLRDADAETDAARETAEDAASDDAVGHQQKLARARVDHATRRESGEPGGDLAPLVLRRAVNTMDGDEPLLPGAGEVDSEGRPAPETAAVEFVSLMRFNGDIVTTREAMNDIEYTSPDGTIDHDHVEVEADDHGIHEYVETTRRGSFLTPPLALRALPTPRALPAEATVEGEVDPGLDTTVTVRVTPADGAFAVEDLDVDALRFGAVDAVDQGRGASPVGHDREGDAVVVEFSAVETDLDPDDGTARLFGKTADGVAVAADVDVV